jgi:serine/threonine protein kinase/dipeptidyl aminopeptidase/acylaminoacyl peptidase
MALTSGTKLGPFEIQSPLGAGGMGEVYRARDSRLGREVAIKVLPESFASEPDRLRRFEQEARAVAALNHPNILAVHDIGAQDGVRYIVTELLEGRTLREQLNDGALPVRKALDYARQIAEGLAAAHGRGIVHRDLKPENVFCTKDGRVKILDFGLAKQNVSTASHLGATMIGATVPDVLTEPGLVMGTVGYMSPEQVRGAPTDHRSDLFSLGAILYELLSGRRAFKRDTAAETMTAILKEEPPELTGTNPSIAPGLDRIVHRCLEKEPAQRFQSASDLGFAIEALSGTAKSVAVPTPALRSAKWRIAAVVGLVLAALAAGWIARSARNIPRRSPAFHQVSYRRGMVYSARLSADGKTVVYTAAWDGGLAQIYIASNEFPESRSIDVKQSVLLSISSTGDLAVLTAAKPVDHFEFQGTLSTMPMGGGAPREILQGVTAADYSPDGQSLAIVRLVSGKYRLEYPSGKTLFETAGSITQPRVSRDGKRVAFLFHPVQGDDRGGVMVVDAGAKATLLSDGWEAEQGLAWTAGGDEVWFSASKASGDLTLHAVTPSGKTREVFSGPGGTRIFDIGADGRFLVSHNDFKYSVTASINGAPERDLSWLDNSFGPALSSDGKRILFNDGATQSDGFYAACLRNTDGSPVIRLGDGAAVGISPDGVWALAILEKTPPEVEVLPTGPGEVRRWVNPSIEGYSGMGWMPNSHEIIFSANESGHGTRFYVQKIGGGSIRPVTPEGFTTQLRMSVSPDGKQFVALNQQTNAWDLCQIEDGKCAPLRGGEDNDSPLEWSADGKYVYAGVRYPVPSIWRIEPATGHRELWRRIAPADSVGALEIFPTSITPDGKSFAIQYDRSLDQLYTLQGLD